MCRNCKTVFLYEFQQLRLKWNIISLYSCSAYNADMENGELITEGHQVTVVVTGFGPFSVHECNPSWEAAQRLQRIGIRKDVRLIIKHIPVEYNFVQTEIQRLWDEHKPELVVHCGVSGVARQLTLEQVAHNVGYISKDIKGMLPPNNCCKCDGPEAIKSGIDMKRVCDAVNASTCCVKTIVSEDAGRYLCDFIYFSSLSINQERTAFIHVPPLNKPYSIDQLSEAIKIAILSMLDQIKKESQACQARLAS